MVGFRGVWWAATLGFVGLVGCSCGAEGSSAPCRIGSDGCTCDDGACEPGLVCDDGRCRPETPAMDAGVPGFDAALRDAGGGIPDVGPNPDAFFADDPPPMECREDGTMGPLPEPPGGTPECPDDKNREGCRCDTVGEMAPCWPGLRANRSRGICRDGVTTCEEFDEFTGRWGECRGYVLPTEGVELGPEACSCFSQGRWEIANLSPCFVESSGTIYAVSTIVEGGIARCPAVSSVPPPLPSSDWSTDALTVDCEGRFELCYTLKAGNADAPTETDCEVAEVCVETWYRERGVRQELPNLPAWTGTSTTCARQFRDSGGYGEMSVRGLSVECDPIEGEGGERYVFNRVNYCPIRCNEMPDLPECERCMMGGSGTF